MFYNVSVSTNFRGTYLLCKTPLRFKSNYKSSLHKFYDKKLSNSISRARNKVFEYVYCNDFYYYVTLTINKNYNRFDLFTCRKNIVQLISNLRKKGLTDLEFLLIPEYHKNGAIHFHGFFSRGFGVDFYINDYGFLSWASYDKYGFSNISKIRNYNACSKYITKYITKDLCNIEKGRYLYFHSKGLKQYDKVCNLVCHGILPIDFDFKNQFCSKLMLQNYDNFINTIDLLNKYYKIDLVS